MLYPVDFSNLITIIGPIAAAFLSVPLIQALVKSAREAGLPTKFAPILSIGIGLILGLIVAYIAIAIALVSITPGILYLYGGFLGVQAGASAAGFYDAAKFVKTEQTTSSL